MTSSGLDRMIKNVRSLSGDVQVGSWTCDSGSEEKCAEVFDADITIHNNPN